MPAEDYILTQEGVEVQALLDMVARPDTTPTDGSDQLVTSGGVKSALDDKCTKVTGATENNFASFASDGAVKDSGAKASDFASASQGGKADTAVQPGDLATVATSGSYTDLSNRPSIPAAQVNSDWNATSGVAEILNKPTIPDAQIQSDWNQSDNTKKDYIKNKPTIPAAQIQSDWNQSDNSKKDFIKNKPSIPAAQVNADWNASSGVAEILNKPTIPVVPTDVSAFNNDAGYLTSTDISGKEDKVTISANPVVSGTLEMADNTEYRFTSAVASLTVGAPSSYPADYVSWLVFVSGSTATSLNYPSGWKWSGDDVSNGTFIPAMNKTYNVCVWYDGININAASRKG